MASFDSSSSESRNGLNRYGISFVIYSTTPLHIPLCFCINTYSNIQGTHPLKSGRTSPATVATPAFSNPVHSLPPCRYYRQAWENLHESASKNSNHTPLRRKETMDQPNINRSRDNLSRSRDNLDRSARDMDR